MKYFVYILQSNKTKKFYTGSCQDTDIRLGEHNSGQVRSTKSGVPWTLIKLEEFLTRQDAYKRERQIKSYKGGEAFRNLINS